MRVFLDLWGVLLDAERMQQEYGRVLARNLRQRFGGDEPCWMEAYTSSWTEYVRAVESADWSRGSWAATVDRLDARFAVGILERAGTTWRPADAVAFSRELDLTIMPTVNARFPDARSAVERLRAGGHSVYVATQATEANARGALKGADLLEGIDGLFTGTSQDALKSQPTFWGRIVRDLAVAPEECVLVDDRADYLRAAGSVGFTGLLVDREGIYELASVPPFVRATLRNLAGLPQFVEILATPSPRERRRAST